MADLPAKFLINSAEVIDNTNAVASESRSLIYIRRRTLGQRYEFRIRSIELQNADIKQIMAGISGIIRSNDVLTLAMPILSESAAATKTAAQNAAIGAFAINLSNTTAVAVGDFFRFSGHTKCYQVTGITGVQIQFTPNLVRPVTTGQTVTFNGVQFTCRIKNRPQMFGLTADRNSATIELDLVEAL
jgi:hypothetical protein